MRTLLVLPILIAAGQAAAQAPQHCATDHRHNVQLTVHPAMQEAERQMEAQWEAVAGQASAPRGGVRKIPVVVHIIQSSSQVRISDDRVQSQIDVLNEDYRKLNADTTNIPAAFQGVAADCGIEFCLATIDPSGCPTTGINRIISPANANHDSNDEAQLKGLIQWNPRKYLNIWVPETMPGLLGYATFPTQLNFSPSLDGVVINGQNFGRGFGTPASSYALGRTGTHEVGHWLGMFHTFQGGCAGTSASNCSTQGDLICDTPPTANENFGCPSGLNTCTETPTDLPDQTTNYMDYGDDPCLNMFTAGQRTRMYFYLDNVRSQIWSPANLTASGCDGTISPGCAPAALFSASTTQACTGSPVIFTDLSTGPASSWAWNFPGGSPATDTTANPVVTYSAPGIYDVTLTVSNGFGTDTEQRISHITVTDPSLPPLMESFESILFLPTGWNKVDEDNAGGWQVNTTVSSLGQNSMYVPNFSLQGTGSIDALISLPIDLTNMGSVTMTYDRAYKRRSAFLVDSMRIDVSTDCGVSWTRVRSLAGGLLATIPGLSTSAAYVPQPTDWRTDTIDLSPFAGHGAVKVRFELKSGGGQNLYLDRVNLDALVQRPAGESPWAQLSLSPNPGNAAPVVHISRAQAGHQRLSIWTLQGSAVWMGEKTVSPAGTQHISLPAHVCASLPAGVYAIRVEDGRSAGTIRWVKTP